VGHTFAVLVHTVGVGVVLVLVVPEGSRLEECFVCWWFLDSLVALVLDLGNLNSTFLRKLKVEKVVIQCNK